MPTKKENNNRGKIIGIGGIFFKSENPQQLTNWYRDHLGFSSQVPYMEGDDAITFKWKSWDDQNENTVWAPFPKDTNYFDPSDKTWMINYIVEGIADLVDRLRREGVTQIGEIDEQFIGKFVRFIDPEGNKIELWEPNREHFSDLY